MLTAFQELLASLAISFDLPILEWIRANVWCEAMDVAMPIVTTFGDGGIFWIAIAVILFLFPKTRRTGLGMAFARAIDPKRGIRRYGDTLLPMDEALILSALDISGRGESYYELSIPTEKVGDFDTELCEEFWRAFARDAGITLHLRQLAGKNSHHIIEGAFKSVARSLRTAVSIDADFANDIPSTKGLL